MIRNGINAVDKALQILASFDTEVSNLTVGDIAEKLGVHKSTASRLTTTLVERGFLTRHKRSLKLGPEVSRIGLLALNDSSLISIARRPMEWLAEKTGETVHLAVLEDNEVLNIAHVNSPAIVATSNFVGRRTKLHCAASGKTFLAFSDKAQIPDPLQAVTERTITDPAALQSEIEQVKDRGWAVNLCELEIGLHTVAVPVFDGSQRCVAALSVDGPSYRVTLGRCPELAALCKQAARAISLHLGNSELQLNNTALSTVSVS
jgi:DNA-binding IclR family transcriptional regulator